MSTNYEVLLAARGDLEQGQDPRVTPLYAGADALIACESLEDAIEQVKAYQEEWYASGDETERGVWAGGDVWEDGQHLGRIVWNNDAGYHLRPGDKGPLFNLYGHYEVLLAARGNPDMGQNPDSPPFGAPPDRLVRIHLLSQAKHVALQFIRDEALGASQWAGGDVWKDGKHQGVIAYNSRFLPGKKGWLVRDGDFVYGKAGPGRRRASQPADTFEGVLCSLSKDDWKNILMVYPEVADTIKAAGVAPVDAAPVQVALVMEGGLVQSVIASGEVEATLVDYDADGEDPDELLHVPQTDGGAAVARVVDFPVEHDADRALEIRAVLDAAEPPLPTP